MGPLALTMLPLSWGCATGDDTTTQQAISGEVVDAQSGRGIASASIEFVSDALDRAQTVSDGDGHFSLGVEVTLGVEYGHITAHHPDYAEAPAASVYFDGIEHVLTLELYRKTRE